jgi:DNA-directed RNA polymerase subunit RPC12/RpoP
MNPLTIAIDYSGSMDYYLVVRRVRDVDLSNFSSVYFGRRFLSEQAHLLLIPQGVTFTPPSYEGGVGFMLIKENLIQLRNLKCSNCSDEPLDPESYFLYKDDSKSYVCSRCQEFVVLMEDVE